MAQGLLKPFIFSFAISLIGCFYGLRTTGGTQGVGRATTQAVVCVVGDDLHSGSFSSARFS